MRKFVADCLGEVTRVELDTAALVLLRDAIANNKKLTLCVKN